MFFSHHFQVPNTFNIFQPLWQGFAIHIQLLEITVQKYETITIPNMALAPRQRHGEASAQGG